MSKKIFNSSLLNQHSKKVKKMIAASPTFAEKVERFEKDSNNTDLEQDIYKNIQNYKADSFLWIQSNGPSIIKNKEQTA